MQRLHFPTTEKPSHLAHRHLSTAPPLRPCRGSCRGSCRRAMWCSGSDRRRLLVICAVYTMVIICVFVWRCSPDIEAATSIIIAYGGSNTPPFVARDILAVHHQHLEAKAAPCVPSRDARGSCRWNCAGTCKQQSNGLTHHI